MATGYRSDKPTGRNQSRPMRNTPGPNDGSARRAVSAANPLNYRPRSARKRHMGDMLSALALFVIGIFMVAGVGFFVLMGIVGHEELSSQPEMSLAVLDRSGASALVYRGTTYQRSLPCQSATWVKSNRYWPLRQVGHVAVFGRPRIVMRAPGSQSPSILFMRDGSCF